MQSRPTNKPCQTVVASLLVAASFAPAQSAAPSVKTAPVSAIGDSWTYANSREVRGTLRSTHNITTVIRSEGHAIGVESHVAGTAGPGRETLLEPDWTRKRSIDGRQTVVSHPFSFPLSPGKSWAIAFTESAPADRRHSSEHVAMTYRVAGWDEITVPAGTFRALRVDGDGTWMVELASNAPPSTSMTLDGSEFPLTLKEPGRRFTGRLLRSYWYVPRVHRWVRYEEATFDSTNTRVQQRISVLEAFQLSDGPGAGARDGTVKSEPAGALPPAEAE